jgi:hypothetical protein
MVQEGGLEINPARPLAYDQLAQGYITLGHGVENGSLFFRTRP